MKCKKKKNKIDHNDEEYKNFLLHLEYSHIETLGKEKKNLKRYERYKKNR